MPSASTTEMPLRLSSGSSGIRTPWKSWLASLRPLSENCPTDIVSSRGIFRFHDDGASPREERPIRVARSSRQARGSRLLRGSPLWCCFDMSRVQREPGEGEAADEVAHHRRDLVPE